MPEITHVVNGVIDQQKMYGYAPTSIDMMYYAVFKPIINRHAARGIEEYSADIVDEFRIEYEKRAEEHSITRSYHASIRKAIRQLTSYVESGTVDFSREATPLKVLISDEHMELVEECLDQKQFTSQGNRGAIHLFMRHFFRFVETETGNTTPIEDETVRRFILYESEQYNNCIGHFMAALRLLIPFLREKGILSGTTDYSVFAPKAPRTKIMKPFSPDEIKSMLDSIDDTPIGKRDRAILLLGYGNGLRAGDIVNLKINDIDWKRCEIRLIQGKTGKPVKLTLNATTMNAIADYILTARPSIDSDSIFLTAVRPYNPLSPTRVSVLIQQLSERAGVEHVPGRASHGLRRSYAINLAESGTDLELISQMLGHTCFSSDRQYLTFNRTHTSLCAMDFSMVPITSGAYHNPGGSKA